jgi:hypothetical protein
MGCTSGAGVCACPRVLFRGWRAALVHLSRKRFCAGYIYNGFIDTGVDFLACKQQKSWPRQPEYSFFHEAVPPLRCNCAKTAPPLTLRLSAQATTLSRNCCQDRGSLQGPVAMTFPGIELRSALAPFNCDMGMLPVVKHCRPLETPPVVSAS